MHRARRRTSAPCLPAALVAAALVALAAAAAPAQAVPHAATTATVSVTPLAVDGVPEPGGERVQLDARIFVPSTASAATPVPAVLLAHGFGGSQDDVADQARQLAGVGYVVVTWTARGFGRSGGRIHLDDPDFEIADASRLIDLLARRDDVVRDKPDDPRVGITGGSYGGGAALMLAGLDSRVDAVASLITWNDLHRALIPNAAVGGYAPLTPAGQDPIGGGVLKAGWASVFFAAGGGATASGPDSMSSVGTKVTGCGRFIDVFCDGFRRMLAGQPAPESLVRLLERNSPASVASRIKAPTLLVQGQSDSLFDLSEADATARALSSAGTPVAVEWTGGGHDVGLSGGPGGADDEKRAILRAAAWFDAWLVRRTAPGADVAGFHVSAAGIERGGRVSSWDFPGYPGLPGQPEVKRENVMLTGSVATITSPRGGAPSAITSVPGLGVAAKALGKRDPQGQVASWFGEPTTKDMDVLGSARVRMRMSSTARTTVLFVSLLITPPGGTSIVPRDLVAPVRLEAAPGTSQDVVVALPAVAVRVPAGSRIGLRVAATDRGFLVPADARTYTVAPAFGQIEVPVAPVPEAKGAAGSGAKAADDSGSGGGFSLVLGGVVLLVVVGLGLVAVLVRSRRRTQK